MNKDKTDKYIIIGNPVKHSLSPKIHNNFAKQTKQNISYKSLEIPINSFLEVMQQIKNDPSIKGLSVTVPFKEKTYEFADTLDKYAQKAGAVSNVIIDQKRNFHGINLDGLGLVNDLKHNLKQSLKNKQILILGAGGATRGILSAIIDEQPHSICIANRDIKKAELLSNKYNKDLRIKALKYQNLAGKFDIIINATSASINKKLPAIDIELMHKDSFAYDLMYAIDDTIFTSWCKQNMINCSDGKGMLLELSKEAFYLWRGIHPSYCDNII